MKYMDWAAMGAASSAYAEASRARSENQDLWHQNQMLSNELGRLQSKLGHYQDELGQIQGELGEQQDVLAQYHNKLGQQQDALDEIRKDIARKKAIQEYQAWIEEFIYKFSKAITNISSVSKDPVNNYDVITSFLDIINKNSLDTSRIRGLENKSAFEQVFVKAQNLFDELEKNPEVQKHKHHLHEAHLEEERKKELARAEQVRRKQTARSEQLRKQEEARLDQKRQADKSRLKQLREQKQRQLQKEQIVSASEALVKSSAKEWEETMSLLKIIGVTAATLILGAIIYSYVK